jgi:phenylpropionate dioxygenase-like ring-hydroxylating dioxygenase large terminal subunit
MPREGDDGLYTQSWYPICLACEVLPGQVIAREFLGGRVVVFRGEHGRVSVLSPYCAHLGMDLAQGKVVGNNLQCIFHHYEYDEAGTCVKTGWGPMPPAGTCVFKFPSRERFNIVWAFNGSKPLFDLPDFPLPDDQLTMQSWIAEPPLACSITEVFCQVPDWGHLRFMHAGTMQVADKGGGNTSTPVPQFEFNDFSFGYSVANMNFAGAVREKPAGQDYPDLRIYVFGTTITRVETAIGGRWAGVIGAAVTRGIGKTELFGTVAVPRTDDSPEAQQAAERLIQFHRRQVELTNQEDMPVYQNIRFRPGALTPIDSVIERYLDYVARFPRANPAADFIYG